MTPATNLWQIRVGVEWQARQTESDNLFPDIKHAEGVINTVVSLEHSFGSWWRASWMNREIPPVAWGSISECSLR